VQATATQEEATARTSESCGVSLGPQGSLMRWEETLAEHPRCCKLGSNHEDIATERCSSSHSSAVWVGGMATLILLDRLRRVIELGPQVGVSGRDFGGVCEEERRETERVDGRHPRTFPSVTTRSQDANCSSLSRPPERDHRGW